MAEALLAVLLEQLRSIVVHELVKEVGFVVGVEKEVENLTGTLTMIQRVLKDADEKQVKSEAVKYWLEQLKDVSYDVDDVLDEWITRILISKMQQPDVNAPIKAKVCFHLFSLFCCLKPIVLRREIGVKIKKLNKQLNGIAKKKDMYNLIEDRSQKENRPITSSIVDVSDIYGRHVDKQVIMSKLLSECSHNDSKVPIISIVGTGGFGKTTLAQLILKEEQVINYFEKQIWVCVSEPFDHQKVAKQIIEEASGKVIDSVGWQALHRSLCESVQGMRFILVLDDVWSFNDDIWKQLKTSLHGGLIGSRIIMTTRDEKIAKLMDSTYIHWLGQLSNDDSWLMFKRIAFWRREDDLEILEDIAKDITQKCKGIPLSIRVLASLMRLEKNIQGWRNVHASNIWDVQEGGVGFLPSILFSYYALPAELKSCLVYCATLPKGAKFEKTEMVRLWMAQGFLGSDGSMDLEIEGAHNFDNLAMRSFFQDFEKDSKGNITSCKMHDLVHDFVQFLSKGETCILEKEEVKSVKIRHLTTSNFDRSSTYRQKKLRTLRLQSFDEHHPNKIIHLGLLHQLARLRVLDLSHSDLEDFPSEVERLLHLRYLNLSYTKLKELPETIWKLLNLQTLKLACCYELYKLPKEIGKMTNLRHLEIRSTNRPHLEYLPQGLGRLSHLRTLDEFIIGDGDEKKGEGCKIRELQLLNHLQGELVIWRLGRLANANEAAEAKLEKKNNLQSLILSFFISNEKENHDDEGILEGLLPHTNLEKLTVRYYRGTKLPDWISSLSNLVKLHLHNLKSLLQLPVLGKFPYLEVLVLEELKSVKRIGKEFYGLSGCGGGRDSVQKERQQICFPKLMKLELANMDALEEWDSPYPNSNNIDFFPNLRELVIYECKGLRALPPGLGKLKSLETLKLVAMDGLKSFLGTLRNDRNGDDVEEDNGEFLKPPTTVFVLFPALTSLELRRMREWEEEMIPELIVDSTSSITKMPHLSKLVIADCPKLKSLPSYLFSHALRVLTIENCPKQTGMQPSLPPLLEKLTLVGDVGVLKNPLFPNNLAYFEIVGSDQSSLPQGFKLLTTIRQLRFSYCKFLDFMPADLIHLTILEQLTIFHCPILAEHFRQGEISSFSSSHVYKVRMWTRQQELKEIAESSQSDSEKSSQSDVNVHVGICCDYCKVYPIVGNRYKCKDCYDERVVVTEGGIGFDLCESCGFDLCEKCYNASTKHPYLVNQHHRQGHKFELSANRGDSAVPVHSDDTSEDIRLR